MFWTRKAKEQNRRTNRQRNRFRSALSVESLEKREVMAATVFLDFGAGLGTGLPVQASTWSGPVQGATVSQSSFDIKPNVDITPSVATKVVDRVKEYFRPYAVSVSQVAMTSTNAIANLVTPADTDRASFVMVADIMSGANAISSDLTLYPTDDFNSETNNTDDAIMVNARNVLAQTGLTEENRVNALSLMIAQSVGFTFGLRPVQASAGSNSVASEVMTVNTLPDFNTRLYNRSDNFFSSLTMLNDRNALVSSNSRLINNIGLASIDEVSIYGSGGNDVFTVRYESVGADSAIRVQVTPAANSGANPREFIIYDFVRPTAKLRLFGGAGNDTFVFESSFLVRSANHPFSSLNDTIVDVFGGTSTDTIELRSQAGMNTNYEQVGEEVRVQGSNGRGARILTRAVGSDASQDNLTFTGNTGNDTVTIRDLTLNLAYRLNGGDSSGDALTIVGDNTGLDFQQNFYAGLGYAIDAFRQGQRLPGRYFMGSGTTTTETVVVFGGSGNDSLRVSDWDRDTDVQFMGNGGTDVYRILAPTFSPVAIEQSTSASQLVNATTGVGYGSMAIYYSTERVEYVGTQYTDSITYRDLSSSTRFIFNGGVELPGQVNDVVRINPISTFGRNFEQTSDALGEYFFLQEMVGGTYVTRPSQFGYANVGQVILFGTTNRDEASLRNLLLGTNVYFYDLTAGDNDVVRAILPVGSVRQQLAPGAWRYLHNGKTSAQVNVDSGTLADVFI